MLEITCPHCDNTIEVIKVVVQDSLRGQNKDSVTVEEDILYFYVEQSTWNLMGAKERSTYKYDDVKKQFKKIIVRVK